MESLIILILFVLISSLGGNRKRKTGQDRNRPQNSQGPQSPAGRRMQDMRDLARQAQQTVSEMLETDGPRPRRSTRNSRAAQTNQTADGRECGYCTGEIAVESALAHHTGSVAAPKEADTPCVDVAALQRQWGLSDLQNALLWQEILDKPLAMRRTKRNPFA